MSTTARAVSRTRPGRQARTAAAMMVLFLIVSLIANWSGQRDPSLVAFTGAVVAFVAALVLAVRANREARKDWLA